MHTNSQLYIYHFQNLTGLAKYRRSDPFLRARHYRSDDSFFPHKQVAEATNNLKEGERVFCICFWNSLGIALENMWSHSTEYALCRVKVDHPYFSAMNKDEDEHLRGKATIFLETHVTEPDSNFSPNGIPHEDLDVLLPNGSWIPLDQVSILSGDPYAGWESMPTLIGSSVAALFVRYRTRATGDLDKPVENWVLIRHCNQICEDKSLYPSELADLVETIVSRPSLAAIPSRWFYSFESDDNVTTREIFPEITFRSRTKMQKMILDWLELKDQGIDVRIGDNTAEELTPPFQRTVYCHFGIADALQRGKEWSYKKLLAAV